MTGMEPCAATPTASEWVTPVAVSYVSSEDASAQGGGGGGVWSESVVVVDNAITARTTVREPEAPVEAYGSVTEEVCPLPTVKLVSAPIMDPLEL